MPNVRPVGIIGTGKEVPERVLTNHDLEKMVDTSDEWIKTRTGIEERHIASPEQATSDLAYGAATKALKAAGISAQDLDLIIVATITSDTLFPSTACLLQARLGAEKAAAFDLSAGCSGLIYAIQTGARFIASGQYEHVLVVGAETLSRFTDWKDRRTCVLFGDGAGAAVLGPVQEGYGLLATELGADGNGAERLILPGGGSRRPPTHETVDQGLHYIKMEGAEVFKFAVRVVADATLRVLEKAGLQPGDVNLFIPHQANTRIIEPAVEKIGLAPETVVINVNKYGNTSAASIGIALDEAVEAGRLKKGDIMVIVGFGAGLTWGASVIRWAY